MSRNYNVLRQLMPVEMGAESDLDLQIEGQVLDRAEASAAALFRNLFADSCFELLDRYESLLGLTPNPEASTGVRRAAVVAKLRERGGVSIPYFKTLSEGLGYEIEIEEPVAAMCGWAECGDELLEDTPYYWEVHVTSGEITTYDSYMGECRCGDRLLDFDAEDLDRLFDDLKPAETFVRVFYAEQ